MIDGPAAFLLRIHAAGLAAVAPERVLRGPLERLARSGGRPAVLAVGKAAGASAALAEDVFGSGIKGLAITPEGYERPLRYLKALTAGHPFPDAGSVAAGAAALELAAVGDGPLLCLLSGGASALKCAPVKGLDLDRKREVIRTLMEGGADIHALNVVRKHLSRLKGGRLAAAGRGRRIITLAISDVADDDPAVIGSGPTVGDPSTVDDAAAILSAAGLDAVIPLLSATPKPDDPAFAACSFDIVARNADALAAAAAEARRSGVDVVDLGPANDDARKAAARHADAVRRALSQPRERALLLLSGGEVTAVRRGDGSGGPNTEYALSLALDLSRTDQLAGVHVVAADTDGRDGVGGQAGALLAPTMLDDPGGAVLALQNSDSAGHLAPRGGLLHTGPSFTNVNDLRAILLLP